MGELNVGDIIHDLREHNYTEREWVANCLNRIMLREQSEFFINVIYIFNKNAYT